MTAAGWFVTHYREAAQRRGVQATARQMRKQGVPLWVALEVLCPRPVTRRLAFTREGYYLG